jgi:RNA polymerase sigma-70 factor (ECF subfamily)
MTADVEFAALAEPFRPELLAHCYRMLGSIHDAEDLVQETYLRAWRGFDRFEGRSSIRRWLYKIATMACLTAMQTRSRRPLPSGLGAPSDDRWPSASSVPPASSPEPAVDWLQPIPDSVLTGEDPAGVVIGRTGVRLAFIAALQLLSARQRAVLTLRDVLGFQTAEVADMLDSTPAAVDSALRRARARLAEAGPVAEDLAEPDEASRRDLLDAYVDAFTRADPGSLVELLLVDVEMEMPPMPTWFTGRDAVIGFFAHSVMRRDAWLMLPTSANTQPAFVVYHREPDGRFHAHGVQVLTLIGRQIGRVTTFIDAALVPTFGHPAVLASGRLT